MKTLDLKKVSEKLVANNQLIETEIAYIDLLKIAINSPSQGGYSVSEMAQRIRLLDTVETAEKVGANSVSFEDSDYQALAKLMKEAKWSVLSRTIVEFVSQFDK